MINKKKIDDDDGNCASIAAAIPLNFFFKSLDWIEEQKTKKKNVVFIRQLFQNNFWPFNSNVFLALYMCVDSNHTLFLNAINKNFYPV